MYPLLHKSFHILVIISLNMLRSHPPLSLCGTFFLLLTTNNSAKWMWLYRWRLSVYVPYIGSKGCVCYRRGRGREGGDAALVPNGGGRGRGRHVVTWELKEERGRFQREAANTLLGLTGNGGGIFFDQPLECARDLVRAVLPGGSGTWKRSTRSTPDKGP